MPQLGASDDSIRALKARIDALDKVATNAMSVAQRGTTTSAKRFRVGVVTIPLTLLGATVTATVKWSSPMTDQFGNVVDSYNVDASCSAIPTTPMAFSVSNQTSDGVTVTFQAPQLLAAGTVVMILGISPAAT